MLTFIQKSVKYDRWMIEGLIDQFIHRLDLRRQKHWILSQVTVVSPRDIFHPQKNSILNNRWSIISNEEFKTSVKMPKKWHFNIFHGYFVPGRKGPSNADLEDNERHERSSHQDSK